MKRFLGVSIFLVLFAFILVPYTYAQDSVRLGVASVSYDGKALADTHTSVALGREYSWYYAETRLDFDRHSAYWNIAQLEFGPRFIKAGPVLMLGDPKEKSTRLSMDFSATFKPWRSLYLNSRWAPVSLNSRPNSKNFLDASVGWQFNF